MSLDKEYFDYPHRSYGMDHDYYDWSMMANRPPVSWPDGKHVALWINVALQYFPLNQQGKPFAPTSGMTTAYPDLRHYTLREYGNRVGIFRLLKAFDKYNVTPTFAMQTRLAERYPYLLRKIVERGDEIICHGWHMDAPHYGGQNQGEEAALVKKSLDGLRQLTGRDIRGWLSPSKSQSFNTPQLLVENGVEYMCDWINDELPFAFRTGAGEITALPLSTELEDRFIMQANLHSEAEYADQIIDAFDFLYKEAQDTNSGRMLALSIHPWMLGQPHRISRLEQVLEHITGHSGVWSAGAGDIVAAATR
ncbi:MAG: polysaccharide deacetylase family protein [Gammaproteobacteria bacterium]|nr:polysaccharide deacetylase family protein [Gammaproteobacteria bacterium]NND55043.1 polysaccharide deacetylase family protein [Gammaproteobacteria bacterium]